MVTDRSERELVTKPETVAGGRGPCRRWLLRRRLCRRHFCFAFHSLPRARIQTAENLRTRFRPLSLRGQVPGPGTCECDYEHEGVPAFVNGEWTNPCTDRTCTPQIGCATSATTGSTCSQTPGILGKLKCEGAAEGYVLENGDQAVDKQDTCVGPNDDGVGVWPSPGKCICQVSAGSIDIGSSPSILLTCTWRAIRSPISLANPIHAPFKAGYGSGAAPVWSPTDKKWNSKTACDFISTGCDGNAESTSNECRCKGGYHGYPSFADDKWTTTNCEECVAQPTTACTTAEVWSDTACATTNGYTGNLKCDVVAEGYYLSTDNVAIKCAPQSTSACKVSDGSKCATALATDGTYSGGSADDPKWTTTQKCVVPATGYWLAGANEDAAVKCAIQKGCAKSDNDCTAWTTAETTGIHDSGGKTVKWRSCHVAGNGYALDATVGNEGKVVDKQSTCTDSMNAIPGDGSCVCKVSHGFGTILKCHHHSLTPPPPPPSSLP